MSTNSTANQAGHVPEPPEPIAHSAATLYSPDGNHPPTYHTPLRLEHNPSHANSLEPDALDRHSRQHSAYEPRFHGVRSNGHLMGVQVYTNLDITSHSLEASATNGGASLPHSQPLVKDNPRHQNDSVSITGSVRLDNLVSVAGNEFDMTHRNFDNEEENRKKQMRWPVVMEWDFVKFLPQAFKLHDPWDAARKHLLRMGHKIESRDQARKKWTYMKRQLEMGKYCRDREIEDAIKVAKKMDPTESNQKTSNFTGASCVSSSGSGLVESAELRVSKRAKLTNPPEGTQPPSASTPASIVDFVKREITSLKELHMKVMDEVRVMTLVQLMASERVMRGMQDPTFYAGVVHSSQNKPQDSHPVDTVSHKASNMGHQTIAKPLNAEAGAVRGSDDSATLEQKRKAFHFYQDGSVPDELIQQELKRLEDLYRTQAKALMSHKQDDSATGPGENSSPGQENLSERDSVGVIDGEGFESVENEELENQETSQANQD